MTRFMEWTVEPSDGRGTLVRFAAVSAVIFVPALVLTQIGVLLGLWSWSS